MTIFDLVPPTVALVAITRKQFPKVDGAALTVLVLAVFAAAELFVNNAFSGVSLVEGVKLVIHLILSAFGTVFLADRVAGVDTYGPGDAPALPAPPAPPAPPVAPASTTTFPNTAVPPLAVVSASAPPADQTPPPVAAKSAPGA